MSKRSKQVKDQWKAAGKPGSLKAWARKQPAGSLARAWLAAKR